MAGSLVTDAGIDALSMGAFTGSASLPLGIAAMTVGAFIDYVGASIVLMTVAVDNGDSVSGAFSVLAGLLGCLAGGVLKQIEGLANNATMLLNEYFSTMSGASMGISSAVNSSFRSTLSDSSKDPLAIDLTGNGIQTVGADQSGVMFDMTGSGNLVSTGWVSQGTGLLVYDPTGTATTLTSISQLVTGFQALAAIDTNGDGVINASDPGFADLRIWVGAPSEGSINSAMASGQMETLQQLGIVSISLNTTNSWKDTGGVGNEVNVESSYATVTWADGHQTTIGDLNLVDNPFYQDLVPPSGAGTVDTTSLPEMSGSGAVYDTQTAAQISPSFFQALQQYAGLKTRAEQVAALPQLLQSWAGTSSFQGLMQSTFAAPNGGTGNARYQYQFAGIQQFTDASMVTDPSDPSGWTSAYQQMVSMVNVLEAFNGQDIYDPTISATLWGHQGASISTFTPAPTSGSASTSGTTWYEVQVNSSQIAGLEASYAALEQSVYQGLLLQTRLAPYLSAVTTSVDATTGTTTYDTSGLTSLLDANFAADPVSAAVDLAELASFTGGALGQAGFDATAKFAQWAVQLDASGQIGAVFSQIGDSFDGLAVNDVLSLTNGPAGTLLVAGALNDSMLGTGGRETIVGGSGADTMDSQGGSATYIGGSGADTMGSSYFLSAATQGYTTNAAGQQVGDTYEAGTGGDVMYGTNYSNTYEFALGDGSDTVVSAESALKLQYGNGTTMYGGVSPNGNVTNALSFGAGITAGDLKASASGADLIVSYSASDSVTLKDWFDDSVAPIQTVEFADGTSYSAAAMLQTAVIHIEGVSGLYTGHGAIESMVTDGGSDTMNGGAGHDTYEITSGAGSTVINTTANPTSAGSSNTNILQFDAATSDQLWFQQVGNDLQVSVIGTSTMVDISGWYASSANQAQEFTASDGKVLMSNEVNSLVSAMAAFSPPAAGVTTLPANYQTQLEPTIAAAWQ